MKNPENLEDLFNRTLAAFPHPLDPTSITTGDFEPDKDGNVEYSEEFTFIAGHLLDDELTAGGWVELRQEQGDITITAFFGVARNGDWEKGRILPECTAIQGDYGVTKNKWELRVDQY